MSALSSPIGLPAHDATVGDPSARVADNVAKLWASAWTQLLAAFPNLEADLAQLERERPTKARALARLESSVGRASGRVLRGTASPVELLKRLQVWTAAVVGELDVRKEGA
jgi:hypothetical protein